MRVGRRDQSIGKKIPELLGGSAISPLDQHHNNGEPSFIRGNYAGRISISESRARHGLDHEGMSLTGGMIPYGATFLIFSAICDRR